MSSPYSKTPFEPTNDLERAAVRSESQIVAVEPISPLQQFNSPTLDNSDEIDRCIAVGGNSIEKMPTDDRQMEWKTALSCNTIATAPRIALPPRKVCENGDLHICLLKFSFSADTADLIFTALSQLLGNALIVLDKEQVHQQLTDSSIVILSIFTTQGRVILNELSATGRPTAIYLLGPTLITVPEREAFFPSNPSVCGMSDNPEELAVQVAVDVALKSRILGDRYAREKNVQSATKKYDQCIELLHHLRDLAERKQPC